PPEHQRRCIFFLFAPHQYSTSVLWVSAHIARLVKERQYRGPTDPLEYLYQRRCLADVGQGTLATLAGLICFGYNPQALFPRGGRHWTLPQHRDGFVRSGTWQRLLRN